MPIHDAAYNGSPCGLQVLASSAISLANLAALVSMITWRRRVSAARGIVRRLTITTSVHELAASKARTSPDPTCPVPPTTKTRKPMLCLSVGPRNYPVLEHPAVIPSLEPGVAHLFAVHALGAEIGRSGLV